MKHNQIQKHNATILTISIKYVNVAITWERKPINHLLTSDVLCLDFNLMAKCYHQMTSILKPISFESGVEPSWKDYHSQRFQ